MYALIFSSHMLPIDVFVVTPSRSLPLKAADLFGECLPLIAQLPGEAMRTWLLPLQARGLHARATAHDLMATAAGNDTRIGDQVWLCA
jgi:hypothetical protein